MVRFGTFEFDPATGELRRTGGPGRAGVVRLEPQPAKALTLLVGRAGEVVTREDLKSGVWGGETHVDFDRGLAYCISQVRAALGDSAENPRFIETLPRRGFRFIAPVSDLADVAPAPPAPPAPPARPARPALSPRVLVLLAVAALLTAAAFWFSNERPVLAVAVFDNETGDETLDVFIDGLPDALVADLGQLDPSRLAIVGNTRQVRMPRSDRDLAAIREETGASFILLGQLQVTESGLRLITHLIRLSDGRHVWVKRFDRPGGEDALVGLEQEVLREVTLGVRERVLGEPGASSPTPASR